MFLSKSLLALVAAGVLAGCAQLPVAPTIAVMPAPGMPFDVFQQDNATCQLYAHQSLGVSPNQAANNQVAGGAVAGAAVGAVAGALIGGNSDAAGVGAATGLLFGTTAGSGTASETTYALQWRYNIAYAQCMYAKGNQVPGYATVTPIPPPRSGAPPPPPAHY
ncbi:MAG: glycine zipper family protein [Gammaproteobacteria bacterium]